MTTYLYILTFSRESNLDRFESMLHKFGFKYLISEKYTYGIEIPGKYFELFEDILADEYDILDHAVYVIGEKKMNI